MSVSLKNSNAAKYSSSRVLSLLSGEVSAYTEQNISSVRHAVLDTSWMVDTHLSFQRLVVGQSYGWICVLSTFGQDVAKGAFDDI